MFIKMVGLKKLQVMMLMFYIINIRKVKECKMILVEENCEFDVYVEYIKNMINKIIKLLLIFKFSKIVVKYYDSIS